MSTAQSEARQQLGKIARFYSSRNYTVMLEGINNSLDGPDARDAEGIFQEAHLAHRLSEQFWMECSSALMALLDAKSLASAVKAREQVARAEEVFKDSQGAKFLDRLRAPRYLFVTKKDKAKAYYQLVFFCVSTLLTLSAVNKLEARINSLTTDEIAETLQGVVEVRNPAEVNLIDPLRNGQVQAGAAPQGLRYVPTKIDPDRPPPPLEADQQSIVSELSAIQLPAHIPADAPTTTPYGISGGETSVESFDLPPTVTPTSRAGWMSPTGSGRSSMSSWPKP